MAKGKGIVDAAVDLVKTTGRSIKANLFVGNLAENTARVGVDRLDAAMDTVKGLDDKGLTEYIKKAGLNFGDDLGAARETILGDLQDQALKVAGIHDKASFLEATGLEDNLKGTLTYAAANIGNYYTGGTTGQNIARVGATVGAYAAGSAMIRGVASFGVNANGESDIAGIPFI